MTYCQPTLVLVMKGGTIRYSAVVPALYTNNSMLDNVSSLDRIPAVTCVCKLLYVVLTNTSILS